MFVALCSVQFYARYVYNVFVLPDIIGTLYVEVRARGNSRLASALISGMIGQQKMIEASRRFRVYSKLGTVIVVIAAIFPFAAVIASIARSESAFTAIIVTVIVAVFFVTLVIASRITIDPELETVASAPRAPAAPIEWSWDGINRQPGAGEGDQATESKTQH
jgi:hypothetical protein